MIELKNFLIRLKNNLVKKKKLIIPYTYKIYNFLLKLKQDLKIAEFYYIKNFLIIIFTSCIKLLKIFSKSTFKLKTLKKEIYKISFLNKNIYFISTTRGVISIFKAYKLNLQGPLVCLISFI